MSITEYFHEPAFIEEQVRSGAWPDKTLDDYLQARAKSHPDKTVIVDRRHRLTFSELDRLAHRVACGFYKLGVRTGDVVSIQLPNWAEWVIAHCAATKVGAVTNSIGAMYRQKEVGYILDYAKTKLLIIPDEYRRFGYTDMVAELWPNLPGLKHVVVVGDNVPNSMRNFSDLLESPHEDDVSRKIITQLRSDPNQAATLMFTSGTTAEPKGVVHTANTIGAGTTQLREAYGLTEDDVIFMASPIGHSTALIAGARLPIIYGMTAVWQEHWDAEEAIEIIEREKCTFTLSATPFLYGMVNAPNASREKLARFKTFACGGAPIPRELIRQAETELGFQVSALYGSSEAFINTAIYPTTPPEQRYGTDGQLVPGVEGRLVDAETGEPTDETEGELQVRTPALYAGYYLDPENTRAVCSPDGWYSTGDLCTLDGDGFVSVVGRKKDMIIRGGANISAREIEELLFTHPKIANVACVAMPDPILAERVCAYVMCEPGATLEFDEMVAFLREQKVSNWKLPERLEIRESFPMTPSGKIQKFMLRAEISEILEREGAPN